MKKNALIMLPVALAVLAGCGEKKKTQLGAVTVEADTVAVPVKVKKVETQNVAQLAEFTANVQAYKTNDIAPQAPARIKSIKAEVGNRVSVGQVLVVMDNTNLASVKVQLDNARVEFGRIDELYKAGGASKSQWDALKTQLELLETSYANMQENTMLRSPIAGVVTARNYDDGDLYAGQPVLVVQQIAPVKLLINVGEQYYTQVKTGMKVDDIRLDAYPGEVFTGKVSIVYPTLDAASRTFPVELTIDNKDQKVRPGMFARVTLNFGETPRVVVPDQAVVKQVGAGDRYVYAVRPDGTVSYDKVELGRRIGAEYEVISGVESGATVVIFGQNKLANGKRVTVVD